MIENTGDLAALEARVAELHRDYLRRAGARPTFLLELLLQPDFDQRLVRHIAGVGREANAVEQVLWQPQ